LIRGDAQWVLEWTMIIELHDADGQPLAARIDLLDVVARGQVVRKGVCVDGAEQMAAYRRAGLV
jgi:hypothetical protein